jgi:hypothetical protein
MSGKDEAIEAYKRNLAADEAIARDYKNRLAQDAETQRDIEIKWRNTILALFREAAAKENSDIQLRLPGKTVPQYNCLEVSNSDAVYQLGRRWMEVPKTHFDAGTMLRFFLGRDGMITASCLQYPQAASGSMHLNNPSREWVQKVFEQVMIAVVKDVTAH